MRPFFTCHLLLLLPTVLSISLPNLVAPGGILTLDNVSQIFNTSTATSLLNPSFLPYQYKVPFTDMTLHLGFGVFKRQALDGIEMERLLSQAQEWVNEHIRQVGPKQLVPMGQDGIQYWKYWMRSGNGPLEIDITSWKANANKKITWGQIAVVLEGLRLYLIGGKRFWVTNFNFFEGRPLLRPGLLGVGSLRKSE